MGSQQCKERSEVDTLREGATKVMQLCRYIEGKKWSLGQLQLTAFTAVSPILYHIRPLRSYFVFMARVPALSTANIEPSDIYCCEREVAARRSGMGTMNNAECGRRLSETVAAVRQANPEPHDQSTDLWRG